MDRNVAPDHYPRSYDSAPDRDRGYNSSSYAARGSDSNGYGDPRDRSMPSGFTSNQPPPQIPIATADRGMPYDPRPGVGPYSNQGPPPPLAPGTAAAGGGTLDHPSLSYRQYEDRQQPPYVSNGGGGSGYSQYPSSSYYNHSSSMQYDNRPPPPQAQLQPQPQLQQPQQVQYSHSQQYDSSSRGGSGYPLPSPRSRSSISPQRAPVPTWSGPQDSRNVNPDPYNDSRRESSRERYNQYDSTSNQRAIQYHQVELPWPGSSSHPLSPRGHPPRGHPGDMGYPQDTTRDRDIQARAAAYPSISSGGIGGGGYSPRGVQQSNPEQQHLKQGLLGSCSHNSTHLDRDSRDRDPTGLRDNNPRSWGAPPDDRGFGPTAGGGPVTGGTGTSYYEQQRGAPGDWGQQAPALGGELSMDPRYAPLPPPAAGVAIGAPAAAAPLVGGFPPPAAGATVGDRGGGWGAGGYSEQRHYEGRARGGGGGGGNHNYNSNDWEKDPSREAAGMRYRSSTPERGSGAYGDDVNRDQYPAVVRGGVEGGRDWDARGGHSEFPPGWGGGGAGGKDKRGAEWEAERERSRTFDARREERTPGNLPSRGKSRDGGDGGGGRHGDDGGRHGRGHAGAPQPELRRERERSRERDAQDRRDLPPGRGSADGAGRVYGGRPPSVAGERDRPHDRNRAGDRVGSPARDEGRRDNAGFSSRGPPGFMDRRGPGGYGQGDRGREPSPPRGGNDRGGGNSTSDKVMDRVGKGGGLGRISIIHILCRGQRQETCSPFVLQLLPTKQCTGFLAE